MSDDAQTLRQSMTVLVSLIGAALRALTAGQRPNIEEVQALLRRAASDTLDPALRAQLEQESALVLPS